MTNYLIRHITDSTNHTFTEVIKPRENERYEIVSAESKAEALGKVENKQQCPVCESWNTDIEDLIDADSKRKLGLAFKCNECKVHGIY